MIFELKEIPLFSKLDQEYLEKLESKLIIKKYEKDNILFYEKEESPYIHILLDGVVRLYKTSPKGTQIHIHNFSAPEIIALFATFEHIPFPASCAFLTKGTVGLLPLNELTSCLDNTEFSLALISALSRRMKLLAELLHKETIFSSEAKIADIIYSNPTIFERLKNNEIASLLNITPETLSRILTKLKRENIITIKKHIVTILDNQALCEIIETNSIN